jgi:TolB-like protein/class 3 adenylate cyclase/Flp pilus assembly protein TadD
VPADNSETRKLAAIMFTDMVGYSALAQRNDQLARALLEEHRALLRTLFPRFNGTEIKTIGDAFLIEFNSALEAAQCGIEIQRALAKRNHDVPADRRVEIKIGIHIGDVVHRGGDVYGDGVNIASRIEALAGAGGICVSMDVERQIRNALEARFEKLAPTELKNISVAMDLFRIVLPWETQTSNRREEAPTAKPGSQKRKAENEPGRVIPAVTKFGWVAFLLLLVVGGGWWFVHQSSQAGKQVANSPGIPASPAAPVAAPVPDPKSIAILPFANMSEETNNAFFADGIQEDLLTTLSSVRDLRVVSRTSVEQYRATTKSMRQIAQELGVTYVLEGSVRRAGNKVRVTGQLIRASSDEQHVWAKSYDRDLTDIFAIQSALATEIADALQAVLSPAEKSLIERRPTDNPAAYDLFLKARANLKGFSTELSRAQCEQALLEAVKLDPDFAEAWAYLSLAHVSAVSSEEDHTPERLAKAKAAIETAVRLAPGDPEVIKMQGSYYYYGYRDYARAAEQYERLLLIRPNSADALAQIGFLYRRQGRWTESLANLRKAAQLDPHDVSIATTLAESLANLWQYDAAATERRRAAEIVPGDIFFASLVPQNEFFGHGSTREMEEWLANQKPATAADETKLLVVRRNWARVRGDCAQAVKINQQHAYLDPYDDPHWMQDLVSVMDLVGNNELTAARARAKEIIPVLNALLEKQPSNGALWASLAFLYAIEGEKEPALRCARKAVELMPESSDAVTGPIYSMIYGEVLAWTGDKEGALAALARSLRTPYGANVYEARGDPGWLPLRGDPRFEALLNDPKNNAPMPDSSLNVVP